MKILVTSDNHLGYKEKDQIRSNDSFTTFEEILQTAHSTNADLLLQGGDLFHDNFPSRNTLIKTIQLLKKYCLGNKEIDLETNLSLNINDQNMNISLPIVSIHGNHDDPSGFDVKSSLDILSSSGLINYIGKSQSVEFLTVNPLLLYKNGRKVAIYGIGNLKDRRIYKLFKENKVCFNRPLDFADYVNILIVHQNRVPHGDNDYLPVDFLDDWFDLVIFGHEHEPIMYPVDSKDFTVIQCGSTVRTSLSEGELGDKYVYLLDIEEEIKIKRIPLKTVRPFIMQTIKIDDIRKMEEILKEEVKNMIQDNIMPLIRIRVDSNGETINKNKFGLLFKENVANYKDILAFTRKKRRETDNAVFEEKREMKDVLKMFMEKIELKALPESLFIEGVRKFAESGNKEIFGEIVSETIKNTVKKLKDGVVSNEVLEYRIKDLKDEVNRENGYYK